MNIKQQLQDQVKTVLVEMNLEVESVELTHPQIASQGDYSTNVAMIVAKKASKNPRELADEIVQILRTKTEELGAIDKIEAAGSGFINFYLKPAYYIDELKKLLTEGNKSQLSESLSKKKIMVEYAHPNTHKEMHIGHMRTLVTGEAIARLLEAAGAEVFRANYQGDIGPHIAKALYGIEKLMSEQKITLDDVEKWNNKEKTHFLGQGYVRGSQDYETHIEEIDSINAALYARDTKIWRLYERTRQWNLDYYDEFYKRFYTQYDRLFFESEMAVEGMRIVRENVGKVFEESQGAIIFAGESYGLHTRVFITQQGLPLYEAKDVANAYKQYEAFPFDRNIHVVASEQQGYFQVVFKALELLDPEKFKDSEFHLSMGMVQLSDRKMSSRTGDILTVDWLLDQVKEQVDALMAEGRIDPADKEKVTEQITIGAVKHSVLKVGVAQDAAFDIKRSVSLEGDSGPYLQYTYARTQSVLGKASRDSGYARLVSAEQDGMASFWEVSTSPESLTLEAEELSLLKLLVRFNETIIEAAERYSPNIMTNYLFDLAQSFNLFYQKQRILDAEGDLRNFRLAITQATGNTLKEGLHLLGIKAPEKM